LLLGSSTKHYNSTLWNLCSGVAIN
jgi:hypothetical protein